MCDGWLWTQHSSCFNFLIAEIPGVCHICFNFSLMISKSLSSVCETTSYSWLAFQCSVKPHTEKKNRWNCYLLVLSKIVFKTCVVQAVLKLTMWPRMTLNFWFSYLYIPSWYYRCVSVMCIMAGTEPRVSYTLGKYSTNWVHTQTHWG